MYDMNLAPTNLLRVAVSEGSTAIGRFQCLFRHSCLGWLAVVSQPHHPMYRIGWLAPRLHSCNHRGEITTCIPSLVRTRPSNYQDELLQIVSHNSFWNQ